MASVLYLDREATMSERLTPPYMDLHERGSYDTEELDALEAAAKAWAELPADDDGRNMALALIRYAYGAGYLRGTSERDE